MKILPRVQARRLGTKYTRFDLGKYKWEGTMKPFYEWEVKDLEGVLAVYPEQRFDKHGKFVVLVAVHN